MVNLEMDQLLALCEHLESDPPADRRQHPRTAARGRVPATLEPEGKPTIRASVRDLSRSGVGLYSPEPLLADERVTLAFRLGPREIRAACRVANCRADDKGQYILGLEFHGIERGATRTGATSPAPATNAAPPSAEATDLERAGKIVGLTGAEIAAADEPQVADVAERLSKLLKSA